MEKLQFIGIDVSTQTLDVYVQNGQLITYHKVTNIIHCTSLNAALNINLRHQASDPEHAPIRRQVLNALIGLDWYPGNDWSVSGQLSDNYIFDHNPKISSEKHSWLATLSITKSLSHNTIKLSSFSYVGLEQNDLFNRSSIDVAPTDEFHMIGGIDVFIGNSGNFGQFQDNSELWLKAKYSF